MIDGIEFMNNSTFSAFMVIGEMFDVLIIPISIGGTSSFGKFPINDGVTAPLGASLPPILYM